MTDKATPRPWKAHKMGDGGKLGDVPVYAVRGDGGTVAEYLSEADAALIASAVNSHDAMVEALENCVAAMHADDPTEGWKEIIDAGRAALTLARGDAP